MVKSKGIEEVKLEQIKQVVEARTQNSANRHLKGVDTSRREGGSAR